MEIIEKQWNIKPRLVRCPKPDCKHELVTDEAGPRCPRCATRMITVINHKKPQFKEIQNA